MAKKHSDNKPDLHQKVTDRIIELLEQGVIPWQKSWSTYGLAKNYVSGHTYTGINYLLMNHSGHPIPYFLTFKQAKALGGKVKKGAKAHQVIFFKMLYKDENNKTITVSNFQRQSNQGKDVKVLKFLKYFNVFNIEQVEGIDFDLEIVEHQDHPSIESCEQIVTNMPNAPKLVYEDANRAYYQPSTDAVNMPQQSQFKTAE